MTSGSILISPSFCVYHYKPPRLHTRPYHTHSYHLLNIFSITIGWIHRGFRRTHPAQARDAYRLARRLGCLLTRGLRLRQ